MKAKTRNGRRAAALALALALAAGTLGGCGKDGDGQGNEQGGGSGNANAALAREHVYAFSEVELPEMGEDRVIQGYRAIGDRVYMVMSVYNWDEIGRDMTNYLVSLNVDGGDIRSVELADSGDGEKDAPDKEDGEEPAQDEEKDPPQGGVAVPLQEAESGDAAPEVSTMLPPIDNTTYEDTNVSNLVFGEDCVYGLKEHRLDDHADPENPVYLREVFLMRWSLEGELLMETPIEGMETDEESYYVICMVPAKDGSVTLFLNGNSCCTQRIAPDGTVEERQEIDSETGDIISYSQYYNSMEPGRLTLMYYDQENWQKLYMVEYNIDTKTLGEPALMPSSIAWGGYGAMTGGLSYDLIYSAQNGIYACNGGDTEATCLMDYTNSDLFVYNMSALVQLDEDRFFCVFYENYEDGYVAGILTRVPPEQVAEKKVLLLGGLFLTNDIRKRTVEFNRNSAEYRIVIKNYDEYNSYEDNTAGQTAMDNDIISGRMPDIFYSTNGDLDKYAEKGWLADIGKRIEQDEELSQTEFVQNVFDTYSVDGKLYMVIPEFFVCTMLAKTSLVGERTSWRIEDMRQVLDTMPEGTQIFEDITRAYFMDMMMRYCGNDFIDLETGECSFDSPEFAAVMELAKTLPEAIDYDDEYWQTYDYWSVFRKDQALLCEQYIRDLRGMNATLNGRFAEPVSYIGFPTEKGPGGVLVINDVYCISAKSPYQDAAWEFVRYYLTEEYQERSDSYNLPTRMDAFEKKSREALEKPYYLDEDGNKVEYDDTIYMGGEEVVIDSLNQEQLDQLVDYIFSVNKRVYNYNEDILNIINEEIEAFYTDQKSAQEVAGLIQNRVQLFVDENS